MTKQTSALLFFLWTASPLLAQEPPVEEEEAPEAIFDQKIGDVGVVLDAEGTWTTRLAGGLGAGFSDGNTLPGLGYPGYEKGGVFVQEPDFTLTLRLLERYYLEIIYSGTLEDRSFLVGYDGKEGEPLQWVKAGNAPFSVPPRAGQTIAEGRRGAPAAGAGAILGPVSLEALVRYEDGARETHTYRGYRDTGAALVGIDEWIRNRFFQLPASAAPLTGVKVMVYEESLRELTSSEVAIGSHGEISLLKEAAQKIIVTWNGAASWTPSASALLGLTPETDPGTGGTWYVLGRPGTASPFEQRNRYPLPAGTTDPVILTDQDKGVRVSGYRVSQSPTQDWFEVSGDSEAPFFSRFPGVYPSTSPPPSPKAVPWQFRLPVPAATSYSLGTDVLPSSLIVLRNGLPATFKFEAASGVLNLSTAVFDTDLIEISFQRVATANKAADLVLWQGGRWEAAEGHSLEWALQGRWNMDADRYTTADLQSPGRMSATAAYSGTAEGWTWKVAATGGAMLTDSTGHRRLFDLNTAGASADLDGDALRPSAFPAGAGVLESDRVPLVYRDYWTSDPLTGTPEVSAWDKPGIKAAGSEFVGPYLVRGDGIREDRLAVIEATVGNGQWAALQMFLDKGSPRDLRSTSAVSVTVRIPAALGGAALVFQAGTVSTDFDGTGAQRSIEYRATPVLPFFDTAAGKLRSFPIPENSSWDNDAGTGVEPDGELVKRDLAVSTVSTDWQTVRFQLTDAERQILQRTTGWRLVLVGGGGTSTLTVLVGPVVFEGSTWSVEADDSASTTSTVSPVEQKNPGKSTRQLRVDWTDRTAWAVVGRHSPLRPAAYRGLNFRYRLTGTSGTQTLTLEDKDSDGRGVRVQWTDESGGWTDAHIDLRTEKMTLTSATGSVTDVSVRSSSAWDRLRIAVAGSSAGRLEITEIEAVDPVWEPVGNTDVSATWTQKEAWPSAGLPLVSGVVWKTVSNQSGLTSDDLIWRGQTSVTGSAGPLRASAEASFLRTGTEQEGHGAYEATLPVGWSQGPRLEWTDRFSDYGLRSERAVLTVPWLGTWTGQAAAKGPPTALEQDYTLQWAATAPGAPDWGATASARWYQTRPDDIPLTGFSDLWVDSWSWLPPFSEAPFYLLEGLASERGVLGPTGWELRQQNRVSQSVGSEVKWTTWGSWDARMPYRAGGWTLTPSLARSSEAVFSLSDLRTPRESAATGLQWLWNSPAGLSAVPFSELNRTVWRDEAVETGKSRSAAGVDWERDPAQDWTDLVVPSGAGSQFSATDGQLGSGQYRARDVSAHIEAKALNVFGTLGSWPVFTWYRTDVWSWAATGRWGTGTREIDRSADASLTTASELVLTPQESVTFPLSYQGRWGTEESHSVQIKPTWSLRGPAALPVEIPRWLSPSAFQRQWVQNLSLSLGMGWEPDPSPLFRDLQVAWKGSLLLSEKGELSLTTKFGEQWQQDFWVVGLEASLDLVLSF